MRLRNISNASNLINEGNLGDSNPTFLKHMHYFRGFAIISIFFVHLMVVPTSKIDEFSNLNVSFLGIRKVLFHASTIYYLFISGFLFFYLSAKFKLKRYYISKFKNVVLPYLILTTIITLYYNWNLLDGNIFSFIEIWLKHIVRGDAQFQYWYIPFIIIVYLLSPCLLIIPNRLWAYIIPVIGVIPLLGTRTDTEITFNQFIYFFPIYILGMYSAMNYKQLSRLINQHKHLLLIVAFVSTIFIIVILKNKWTYQFGSFNTVEGLFYIQKISITFLVINFLRRYEDRNFRLLNQLASYSFGIYFTHILLSTILYPLKLNIVDYFSQSSYVILISIVVLYTIFLLLINLFILKFIKRILGKNSRIILGV